MTPLESAEKLIRAGKWDDALASLNALVEANPNDPAPLGTRAWLLFSKGDHASALADYEKLLAINPQDSDLRSLHSLTLLRLGRKEEAIREALTVLGEDPMNSRAVEVFTAIQQSEVKSQERPPLHLRLDGSLPHEPLNAVIKGIESDPKSFPTSIFPQLGRFFYALALTVRPTLMIETGSNIGYSTLCWAQALEDGDCGHLHTFDLFPENESKTSPVLGECKDRHQMVAGHLEQAGLAHRVTLHRGDSSSNVRETFAGKSEICELAFIDGDHTMKGCMRDWEVVAPLMKEGGLIVLHDTNPDHCKWWGPRYLMENLRMERPEDWQVVNIPTLENLGTAIIQRVQRNSIPTWWPTLRQGMGERFSLKANWK